MAGDVAWLLGLSGNELDDLFRRSGAGRPPVGEVTGTVLVAKGRGISDAVARLVRLTAWKGKVFDDDGGALRNRVTPLGIPAVAAKVYKGVSLTDGRECIVVDYSKTSLVARWVRDELREVGPGLYLGRAFLRRRHIADFALSRTE